MQVQAWNLTDVGKVRAHNEDCCFSSSEENQAVGIVCDGMGGASAGEVASELGVEVFTRVLSATEFPPEERMRAALEQANREIFCYGWEHPESRGLGTTLVAALVLKHTAYILNVGDSRAYCIADGAIRQITEDHSLVAELVRAGQITPEQARTHPRRNIITRALGTDRHVTGDLFLHEMAPGEQLLLCSDGLTNELEDDEILAVLKDGPSCEACQRLVDSALEKGARDNVTAVLLELPVNSEE